MPWYKSGTVSVTLNSSAVLGSNTAFIANSRVGDGFRGPDGRWYEVTNIASDTAMSISPAYQGATASGGSYALAPLQGYVKDSADALRALVNQFGTKLSELGTTGNYDILPVNKGGTGGTSQAEARAGIGLGPNASLAIGSIEISSASPFIDFHFGNDPADYNVRLINSASGTLNAAVANANELRVNGSSVWNDANVNAKLGAMGVGAIGSYGFFLTNTALTPGGTTVGGNLQYAFAVGQGGSNPTGTWRCMGDTVTGGRTLFQRVS